MSVHAEFFVATATFLSSLKLGSTCLYVLQLLIWIAVHCANASCQHLRTVDG